MQIIGRLESFGGGSLTEDGEWSRYQKERHKRSICISVSREANITLHGDQYCADMLIESLCTVTTKETTSLMNGHAAIVPLCNILPTWRVYCLDKICRETL